MTISTAPASWFRLDRHDVRSTLPAAIQAIMQNGLLDRTFQEALIAEFMFPALASSRPWRQGIGDTGVFTRTGLLNPTTTPLGGADPATQTYAIEQYSVTMDQYGIAMDTNMLQSAMTLEAKFMEDIEKLGISAGQSLNRLARNKLFNAYGGGLTWCITAASSDTSIQVQSVAGFQTVVVNGVPTPVSGANPLNVTIGGVANTVTGVNVGTRTLTLGTARVDVLGDAVVSANAPYSARTAASTPRATDFNLAAGDIATLKYFRAAVARLRSMNVPTINGYYVAHIDPTVETQLYSDADFKQALTGRVDSPVYRDLSIGRFQGIDWVRNNEMPTLASGTDGLSVNVHRSVVMGGDALLSAPFDGMGALLAQTDVSDVPSIRMIDVAPGAQVAMIIRPPQDRLQQVIGSAWSWVGDYGVPSDLTTGDSALFKRAVVIDSSES
jgi:hypothetical protein